MAVASAGLLRISSGTCWRILLQNAVGAAAAVDVALLCGTIAVPAEQEHNVTSLEENGSC